MISIANRTVTIERRGRCGWFIVERGQTIFGFQTKRLLDSYIAKVRAANRWHTPTASECYR